MPGSLAPSPVFEPLPPRARRQRHGVALFSAALIAAIVLLPIGVIVAIALSGSGEDWPHLAANVIPRSVSTTLWMLAMVAVLSASIGVTSA